jgi:hypothetical protein
MSSWFLLECRNRAGDKEAMMNKFCVDCINGPLNSTCPVQISCIRFGIREGKRYFEKKHFKPKDKDKK